MAILSTVLLAVYRLQAQSISTTRAARFQALAPLLARQKLADVERLGNGGPFMDSGDFGETYPGFAWQAEVGGAASEHLGDVGADLRRIELTISLNSDEFRYRLRTYRFFQR